MATFDRLLATSRRFGPAATASLVFMKGLQRIAHLQCLAVLTLGKDALDRSFPSIEPGFSSGWIDSGRLRALADADASLRLSEEFLSRAFSKGDRCYGVFLGDDLASYCWYSARPTVIRKQLTFYFDPEYTYSYKAYTRPEFRGRRLHAVGKFKALKEIIQSGSRGIVSYVNYTNLASLRSCKRIGFERKGMVMIVGTARRYWTWASPGCTRLGVRVTADKPPDAGSQPAPGKR